MIRAGISGRLVADASKRRNPVNSDNNTGVPDDSPWFADHPGRLFRARAGDGGIWLIRRQPQGANRDTYLRTFSRTSPPTDDSDGALAVAWHNSAYPHWSPERMIKAARRALKRGRP
jgi:hypothetical protein